jgi:hypothetical protein
LTKFGRNIKLFKSKFAIVRYSSILNIDQIWPHLINNDQLWGENCLPKSDHPASQLACRNAIQSLKKKCFVKFDLHVNRIAVQSFSTKNGFVTSQAV